MKKYIGTKTVLAMPMAKSEAEKVLNRSLADATGGEDGYLVEYEDGYKSWSPKETFEKAYNLAETSFDRMLIEAQELAKRTNILSKFVTSPAVEELLSEDEQQDLRVQVMAMAVYRYLLNNRIWKTIPKITMGKIVIDSARRIITDPIRCDSCPYETDNCKKLIRKDGLHFCV